MNGEVSGTMEELMETSSDPAGASEEVNCSGTLGNSTRTQTSIKPNHLKNNHIDNKNHHQDFENNDKDNSIQDVENNDEVDSIQDVDNTDDVESIHDVDNNDEVDSIHEVENNDEVDSVQDEENNDEVDFIQDVEDNEVDSIEGALETCEGDLESRYASNIAKKVTDSIDLEHSSKNKSPSAEKLNGNSNELHPYAESDDVVEHIGSPLSGIKCVKNNSENEEDVDCIQDENDIILEENISECEGSEEDPKAEDTISINLDSDDGEAGDEASNDSHINNTSIKKKIKPLRPDKHNGDSKSSHSSEPHPVESENEECVAVSIEKASSPVQLRRSSRAIKRKIYTDDGEKTNAAQGPKLQDTLNKKSRPIIINDTRSLIEMAHPKYHRREQATLVIIDSKGRDVTPPISKKPAMSATAQSLYQSIVARGTTVTPVASKINTATQCSPTPLPAPAPILPSLTDDMFVVEAPSFIVPYVYEKPSIKPFREFVDKLGQEIEEKKAKEEKETERQKVQITPEDSDKKEENDDKGNKDAENPQGDKNESGEKKKKMNDKKDRRKQPTDDDDASWDGESSSDSEEGMSAEEKTVILKDKADPIDSIQDMTGLSIDKVSPTKPDNYFDCSLGKFFINIGLNLVQEYVQTDLLKQQNRKLYREKKTGQDTKERQLSIALLAKNLELSKENNAPYAFTQKKCELCSFKSESALVTSHHLETPHMKNNLYKCNFCEFEIKSPHDILYHMESKHNVRGKLERAPAYHQCANCPFEDNGKGKLARHLIPCAKKFKPDTNLAPPVEWEPPAKIPKMSKSRNSMANPYHSNLFRNPGGTNLTRPLAVGGALGGATTTYRPRARMQINAAPRNPPLGVPIARGLMVRHNVPIMSNCPTGNNATKKSGPSISITPLPRQPPPHQTAGHPHSKSTFVICEICDGYIKDLEQLRNHMQWIHKVKIHPKMIYNRPPLNCQKCQFRFFTDQGLERHLLGSHGLVTSSMQEAANKGKDAGRCPVCGRVYQWKLLNHVARDHQMTLKPAHLSYKCTVCTATFGMYKQFENHVYSAHSVVAKRVIDKNKNTPTQPSKGESMLKPMKINDEITIIPQPMKAPAKDK